MGFFAKVFRKRNEDPSRESLTKSRKIMSEIFKEYSARPSEGEAPAWVVRCKDWVQYATIWGPDRTWWGPCPDCRLRELELHRKDIIARDMHRAEWVLNQSAGIVKALKDGEERTKIELLRELHQAGRIEPGSQPSSSLQPNDSPPPYTKEPKNSIGAQEYNGGNTTLNL